MDTETEKKEMSHEKGFEHGGSFWRGNKIPLSILVGSVLISGSILWSSGTLSFSGASSFGKTAASVIEKGLSIEALKAYAKQTKLDTKKFEACLNNGEAVNVVNQDLADGQGVQVSGTPTFFINGKRLVGALPYKEFEANIENALNNAIPESEKENVPARGDAPVLGKSDAPVTIVEFSDFECPYCARFMKDTYPQIKTKYIDTGKVRVVFRHFPLSFHASAQKAAEAGECAARQGKFSEFHELVFQKGQEK
jgi:protein-disulfide isomerase